MIQTFFCDKGFVSVSKLQILGESKYCVFMKTSYGVTSIAYMATDEEALDSAEELLEYLGGTALSH